jgi:hypothetical protein
MKAKSWLAAALAATAAFGLSPARADDKPTTAAPPAVQYVPTWACEYAGEPAAGGKTYCAEHCFECGKECCEKCGDDCCKKCGKGCCGGGCGPDCGCTCKGKGCGADCTCTCKGKGCGAAAASGHPVVVVVPVVMPPAPMPFQGMPAPAVGMMPGPMMPPAMMPPCPPMAGPMPPPPPPMMPPGVPTGGPMYGPCTPPGAEERTLYRLELKVHEGTPDGSKKAGDSPRTELTLCPGQPVCAVLDGPLGLGEKDHDHPHSTVQALLMKVSANRVRLLLDVEQCEENEGDDEDSVIWGSSLHAAQLLKIGETRKLELKHDRWLTVKLTKCPAPANSVYSCPVPACGECLPMPTATPCTTYGNGYSYPPLCGSYGSGGGTTCAPACTTPCPSYNSSATEETPDFSPWFAVLGTVTDLCFGGRPGVLSACASLLELAGDLCCQPSGEYLQHPPQYVPPSPLPPPMTCPAPTTTPRAEPLPRMPTDSAVSRPIIRCAGTEAVPAPADSGLISVTAEKCGGVLGMSVGGEACLTCKKMVIKTAQAPLALGLAGGHVHLRTADITARADRIRTDRKCKVILDGSAVLHSCKDGHCSTVTGQHIELDLGDGSVKVTSPEP